MKTGSTGEADVGYGKPPQASQFQKGKSGNPSGRPKGAKSWRTLAREEGERIHSVTEGGIAVQLTAKELLVRKVFYKAINGDDDAIDRLERWIAEDIPLTAEEEDDGPVQGPIKITMMFEGEERNSFTCHDLPPNHPARYRQLGNVENRDDEEMD